jgi:TPR repeat protein
MGATQQAVALHKLLAQCDGGNVVACHNVAALLAGAGPSGDATARDVLARACSRGLVESCATLGEMTRDATLLQRACAAGHLRACKRLEDGFSDPPPPEQAAEGAVVAPRAKRSLQRECEGGDGESCGRVGQRALVKSRGALRQADADMFEADAKHFFSRGCALNDAASCYGAGVLTFESDRSEALAALDKSAKTENPRGACVVGHFLEAKGSEELAQEYFAASCARGFAPACARLGLRLMRVKRLDAARDALRRGCEGGVAEACRTLRELGHGEGGAQPQDAFRGGGGGGM